MKITVNVGVQDLELIQTFLDSTKDATDGNSHGPLNLEKLVAMLLEDIALTRSRPGSWEGHNMLQVLRSHGYF